MVVSMEDGGSMSAHTRTKPTLTPPTSDEGNKPAGSPASELSDLEPEEDDIGDIDPDHYYEGGRIPVFKPTLDQFRSFPTFIKKINRYGMKSGVVKVVPPKDWRDSLPALDRAVKTIKVKNPITQEFSGAHGTYTQANIEKQRSYNLPQWKALTEETQHQPPARRGERRKQQERPARTAAAKPKVEVIQRSSEPPIQKRKPGRPRKNPVPEMSCDESSSGDRAGNLANEDVTPVPPTPTSPNSALKILDKPKSVKTTTAPRAKCNQPRSVTERRKYNRQETADDVDEAAFENFDYRFHGNKDFTPERCNELETLYWKSLTFAPPMYGADMPGSLFDDSTTSWNVAKLENLLDILGQQVPGVNTAYLYLGMWKATFAWHLEDVDLYSINYIHFGAPKQWYSISQEDARRFENAMKSVWPNDAKNCSQFLRHKTYLISPTLLKSQYGITVNKMVHYEGEFVITFPYGYHSGYNLGYNCAESVNFATEEWLDYGRIAKKCDCEADSVWVDVGEIERKLRGEPTPEYYEETDEDDLDEGPTDLPSPPASVVGKPKSSLKRKRPPQPQGKAKKIKIRLKTSHVEPCVLCPNDMPFHNLLPTDTGRFAHKICALYTPETTIDANEFGSQNVGRVTAIDKARLELKCSYCRLKKGACFQCSERKCTRAFHATCAAAAGVRVEQGMTSWFDTDGTEYEREIFDFRCRFHRPKRPKTLSSDALESDSLVTRHVRHLKLRDVVQVQFLQGEIFAGTIAEIRPGERAFLVDVLPEGDRVEVEWKYVLVTDPEDSKIPRPSANAKPLPAHLAQQSLEGGNAEFGPPVPDDPFGQHGGPQTWAEFKAGEAPRNPDQTKIDFTKTNQIWYYLGRFSTDARAQYTDDPTYNRDNPAANFLNHVRQIQNAALVAQRRQFPSANPVSTQMAAPKSMRPPIHMAPQPWSRPAPSASRYYQYKPKIEPLPSLSPLNPLQKVPNSSLPNQAYNPSQPRMQSTAPTIHQAKMPPSVRPAPSPLSQRNSRQSDLNNPYQTSRHRSQQRQPPQYQAMQHHSTQYQNPHPVNKGPPQAHGPDATQQTAPVAKMVTPLAQTAPTPTLEPQKPAPSCPVSLSTEHDYLSRISKYPYLRNAFLRRPKTYKSPYLPDGTTKISHLSGSSSVKQELPPSSPVPLPAQHHDWPARKLSMQDATARRPPPPSFSTKGISHAGAQQSQESPGHAPHLQPHHQTHLQLQQQVKEEGDVHAKQRSGYEKRFEQIAKSAGVSDAAPPGS